MSGKRRVGVQEFKGKVMVNVREYYEKDGQMLPGKKVRVYSFFYCFSSGMGMKRPAICNLDSLRSISTFQTRVLTAFAV